MPTANQNVFKRVLFKTLNLAKGKPVMMVLIAGLGYGAGTWNQHAKYKQCMVELNDALGHYEHEKLTYRNMLKRSVNSFLILDKKQAEREKKQAEYIEETTKKLDLLEKNQAEIKAETEILGKNQNKELNKYLEDYKLLEKNQNNLRNENNNLRNKNKDLNKHLEDYKRKIEELQQKHTSLFESRIRNIQFSNVEMIDMDYSLNNSSIFENYTVSFNKLSDKWFKNSSVKYYINYNFEKSSKLNE